MKKQFISNAARKTILFFSTASFVLFSFMPFTVHAQGKKFTDPQVVIKYIGSVENQPVFQIEFENRNAETLNFTIRDSEGNILYGEKTKEKKFLKKFQYQDSGIDNVTLTFTISGEKDRQSQSYEINTRSRMVQDVVVTRL